METVLEGRKAGELDAGGGGWWSKIPRRGEGPMVCRIVYLERIIFTSWLMGAYDFT